jgi:hypothetical protein
MKYRNHPGSVADPGCLSRIPDPDFYPSRIPDLRSRIQKQQQKREVKKISCHTFLWSHKFHKIVNYFSFEVLKKKILANFQRIIELFTKKNCQKALKHMVLGSGIRDPRSGILKKPIPDPGSRGQRGTGSRIWIRNTASWWLFYFETVFQDGIEELLDEIQESTWWLFHLRLEKLC